MKHDKRYRKELGEFLDVDLKKIHLYWKGRVALYALLKSMGIGRGDEVILPAFTCVVVPNAILYLGAKPVYVDIDDTTLNTTLDRIEQSVTKKTKCIIIQNTFGLSNEVEVISNFAKQHGMVTIEDCTHGFGGTYNKKPNGSFCDAAFYSTQWNKPFSTGVGGFALMNNECFLPALKRVDQGLRQPSRRDRYMLSMLIQVKKYLLHDSTYWFALKTYRKLSKKGVVTGSSESIELTSTEKPEEYFLSSTAVQNRVGIKALGNLEKDLTIRKQNGLLFNEWFKKNNKWHYKEEDLDNHAFLKYPVFVKNKKKFKSKAEKAKVRLGDWFESPIHPVENDFEKWRLNIDWFPVAKEKSTHILNLETGERNSTKMLKFLEKNIDELL